MSKIWITRAELRGMIREAVSSIDEKYMGFKKLKGKLSHQKGVEDPGALAASIGRKKYGKKKFQRAASVGKKMHENEGCSPDCQCEMCEAKRKGGTNPWAVCHASTGSGKGKKFERCVQDVKKQHGMK